MKKTNIVKKTREFDELIKLGKSIKNNDLVIYYKDNDLEYYRFGISVGKKIGNAVIRNKYKRKIRNIIDNNKNKYEKNQDYIIILRKNALDLTFEELEKSYINLINKITSKEEKNEK